MNRIIITIIIYLMITPMRATAQEHNIIKAVDMLSDVPGFPKREFPTTFGGQSLYFEKGKLIFDSFIVRFPFDNDPIAVVVSWSNNKLTIATDSTNPDYDAFKPDTITLGPSDIVGSQIAVRTNDRITNRKAIHNVDEGVVITIASTDATLVPGTSDLFTDLGSATFVNDNSVIFEGVRPDGQSGLYGVADDGSGGVFTIVDQSTPFPTFNDIGIIPSKFTPGESSGDRFSFRAQDGGLTLGLYTSDIDGNITTIAELNEPMPGGVGRYRNLGRGTILPSMDGDQVAFAATDQDSELSRIFIADAITGDTTILLDNTQLPTETQYPGLFMPSISNGDVAFLAGFLNGSALLVNIDGVTTKILESGEMLDGKTVQFIEMSPYSFDNGQIAFSAFFMDNTSALYVATIPTPGGATILAMSGIWGFKRRRRPLIA